MANKQFIRTAHSTAHVCVSVEAFIIIIIVLGFDDTSTHVGHFVSSPEEEEKRNRRNRGDEREGQGRQRYRNESEETE